MTIDAMGCQKEIATTIIERGADYVLALKRNQGSLFEDVRWLFQQAQGSGFESVAHSFSQSIDKGHGRIEIRRCWTLSKLDYLIQRPLWQGLQTVVMVQSERRYNGQMKTENRFFIRSPPSQAALLMKAVRTHWSIENSLHWVLDISFHEDACRIRRDLAPQNMALLRPLALNLLDQAITDALSTVTLQDIIGWFTHCCCYISSN